MNQMVGVSKCAEIGLSGGLSPVTGHPMGTRLVGKGAQPIKVKHLRLIFRFPKPSHGVDPVTSAWAGLTARAAKSATQLGGLSADAR
jgi:hypothetical protein